MQRFRFVSNFSLLIGLAFLVAAVGCGGSGSPILSHTTGNFSNASLNGSYVYRIQGGTATNAIYREVGVFTADGNGNITAGTDDSSAGIGGTPITGNYTVSNDGTGFIGFNTSSLGIPITFAITLVSTSQVQLIENDSVLNASGIAELQDSTAVGAAPSGTFVFRLHQEQSAQNPVSEEASQVGAVVLSNGTGSGAMDQNLGGTFSSPAITATFNAPNASGRGTASVTDTSVPFTTNLVYYVVSSGKVDLLVSNPNAVGSGSAEAQSGAVNGGLAGNYAFGSRGDDAFLDGVATVGQFNAASGSISGTEDTMVDGTYTPSVNISNCFNNGSAGGINGREVVVACQTVTPLQVFWMVSPTRAFFLDNNITQFQDGTADAQSSTAFTASSLNGQFVINMDGLDRSAESVGGPDQLTSRIGTLQFNGAGNIVLNEFVNEFNGGQSPGISSGSYSVSGNGRVVANITTNVFDVGGIVMYAVSGSQAYAMQQDAGLVTSGTVTLQQQ